MYLSQAIPEPIVHLRVLFSTMLLSRRALVTSLLFAAIACHPEFQITNYPTNEKLYRAAQLEFAARRWDNAIAAFEKLTTDLPARDTLLPRAHWFLARAHQERGENILAATSFTHLVESFPNDTLADDAALESARSYRKMWRKPSLDPTYGLTAEATYTTLLGLFPDSPLIPQAKTELDSLEDFFAQKNYLTGMYYFRREAYDPGMIYFKDILLKWPTTPTAKSAQLRLVESYKAIRYKPEAAEACAMLRKSFPEDPEVKLDCQGVEAPVVVGPAPTTGAPPSTTGPPGTTRPATPPAH